MKLITRHLLTYEEMVLQCGRYLEPFTTQGLKIEEVVC